MPNVTVETFRFRAVRAEDGLMLEVELEAFVRRNARRLEAVSGTSRVRLVLPPQHFAEQTFLYQDGTPDALVQPELFRAEAAEPTTLVFQITEGQPRPLEPITLEGILALCERAQLVPGASVVELPTRMFLALAPARGWRLRATPALERNRYEIWTARNINGATIKPIGSRDAGEDADFTDSTPLTVDHRHGIVASATVPLPVRDLALSAQGAWLDVDATFETPTQPDIYQWVHRSTMGRDQFVRVVERGFLYPTGHRALYVTVSQRMIEDKNPPFAYLEKRTYVELEEPERTFAFPTDDARYPSTDAQPAAQAARAARQLAMKSLRVLVKTSPALDAETADRILLAPTFARWVRVGGRHFLFPMRARDADGQPVDLDVPVIFVKDTCNDDPAAMQRIRDEYAVPEKRASTWYLGGQRMALAPSPREVLAAAQGTATRLSVLELSIDSVLFPLERPSFHAVIASARVRLPEVEQIASPAATRAGEELLAAVATNARREWETLSSGLRGLPSLEGQLRAIRAAVPTLQLPAPLPSDISRDLDDAVSAVNAVIGALPAELERLSMAALTMLCADASPRLVRALRLADQAVGRLAAHEEARKVIATARDAVSSVVGGIESARAAMRARYEALEPTTRLAELQALVNAFNFDMVVQQLLALCSRVPEPYLPQFDDTRARLEREKAALVAAHAGWQRRLQDLETALTAAENQLVVECIKTRDALRAEVTDFLDQVQGELALRVTGALAGLSPVRAVEALLGLGAADLATLHAALGAGATVLDDMERGARRFKQEGESLLDAVAAGIPIKYPLTYLEDGFGQGSNPKQVFAELIKTLPTAFDTSKLAGLVEPNFNIKGLARQIGPLAGELFGAGFDPSAFFASGAKILGVVPLSAVLKTLPILDQLGPIPRLRLEGDSAVYTWLTTELQSAGPFRACRKDGTGKLAGQLEIEVRVSPNAQTTKIVLTNVGLDLWQLIAIDFERLSFVAMIGGATTVDVKIADVRLEGQLDFFDGIRKTLQTLTGVPGLTISREAFATLRAAMRVAVPDVGFGIFALQALSVGTEVDLSLRGAPIVARFRLGEKTAPFTVSVALLSGGGFLEIEVGSDGVRALSAALEFGASLTFALGGVASGRVYAMGGVFLSIRGSGALVEAYLRIGGHVKVLGIVSVSMVFYLSLRYANQTLTGAASVTVNVKIAFFSIEVHMTVERTLAGGARAAALGEREARPTVEGMLSFPEFTKYRAAFAP